MFLGGIVRHASCRDTVTGFVGNAVGEASQNVKNAAAIQLPKSFIHLWTCRKARRIADVSAASLPVWNYHSLC